MRRSRWAALAALPALVAVVAAFPFAVQAQQASAPAPGTVVIGQVYGGGGNAGSPQYRNDFIGLFNRGSEPVSLANTSLHYASATGTGNFVRYPLPTATLEPGQRFLVQAGTGGSGTGEPLPEPDATIGANLHHQAGKVVLATGTAALECTNTEQGTNCTSTAQQRILDVIGYGNANFFEGTGPAPALTITTAAFRNGGSCQDTNDNRSDFHAAAPLPRNSSVTTTPCARAPEPTNPPAPVIPNEEPPAERSPALPEDQVPTTPEELEEIEPSRQEVELINRVESIVERIEAAETPADVGLLVPELVTVGDNLASASPVIPEFAELGARHPGCNGIEIAVTKVQPRSTAKRVLDAKANDWNCDR